MKFVLTILIVSLTIISTEGAQRSKSKGKRPASRPPAATAPKTTPRIIGSPVVIVTKNGDRIAGQLLDLTAYSVRIKAANLESTIALDTVASLSFGSTPPPAAEPKTGNIRPEFARDAGAVLGSLESIAVGLKAGLDYSDYDRQVTEMRRAAERFAQRYSATESVSEARIVALIAAGLTDYTWARTIWTLILGRPASSALGESDSLAIADTVAIYPDLRAGAASGNKYVGEKLIAGLWKKAYEKTERARALLGKS